MINVYAERVAVYTGKIYRAWYTHLSNFAFDYEKTESNFDLINF